MKVKRQISYERARALFDYRDGDLFWRRMDSGKRGDLRASTSSGKGVRKVRVDGVSHYLNYLIWNWHFGETEHRIAFSDGDTSNTRIENMFQVSIALAHTRKEHRMIPRRDLLPPRPKIIGGKLRLTDLRMDCPCCGQSVPNIPPNMIAMNLKLSPMERRIFEVAWAGAGEPVQTEKFFDRMYEDDPDGGPTPTRMYATFKETLFYLRNKLEGSGVGVESVGYRAGYRLVFGVEKGNA